MRIGSDHVGGLWICGGGEMRRGGEGRCKKGIGLIKRRDSSTTKQHGVGLLRFHGGCILNLRTD